MKNNGIYSRIREIYADDRGITGLETAIILIAFIVVAAVFAFTVMTTGLFSTEKAKTTAQAGIAEASSTFSPKGAIIATSNLTYVQTFQFQVTLATGAVAASITPADLAFIYSDKFQSQSSSGVVANTTAGILNDIAIGKIVGTPSNLLEQGDVAQITVTLNIANCGGCAPLAANTSFRIEIIPPAGGSMIISRKTPPALTAVMNLE